MGTDPIGPIPADADADTVGREPTGPDLPGADVGRGSAGRDLDRFDAVGREPTGEDLAGWSLPDEAWVAALAALDGMGPIRLTALLRDHAPADAWSATVQGRLLSGVSAELAGALGARGRQLVEQWQTAARATDPVASWQAHAAAGIGVAIRTSAAYPAPFEADLEPPPIIFSLGDPDALAGARVAIVGTRDCTRYGHDIARSLGRELASAGVAVVSGLALGVDGAAHAGALEAAAAPPIAVVGSGLDIVYPRRNIELWRRVVEVGVVLSEYPLGTRPAPWRFPARNRLIAALADVVVVVESPEKGGSMLTAEEAALRGTTVLAVPGPVTSATSAGTNKLLFEGVGTARDATDVLLALGLSGVRRRRSGEVRESPTVADSDVLDAFGWQPATLDRLMIATGLGLYELTAALDRLTTLRWVDQRGGWYERVAKPDG